MKNRKTVDVPVTHEKVVIERRSIDNETNYINVRKHENIFLLLTLYRV
nr:DUF2382 domain-containing protein [Clostridium muellerianum]